MIDLLFVYGSLRSDLGHEMGRRLAREADLIGAATVAGRLYRVDWYPGVGAATTPDERVEGELYRLRAPQQTFVWLDAYEELTGDSAYERVVVEASLSGGGVVPAWIYRFRAAVDHLEPVPSGRWTRALAEKKR